MNVIRLTPYGEFEWDEQKEQLNKRKHGIAFDNALSVFADEALIEIFDPDNSPYLED